MNTPIKPIASLGVNPNKGQLIPFPTTYKGIPRNPKGRELLAKIHARKLAAMNESFTLQVAENIGSLIGQQLLVAGFSLGEDDMPDATLIHNGLLSLMLRQYGIAHPLQALAQDLYSEA